MTRTELAHRTSDGIAVTLYWARHDNSVSVEVEHFATGDTFVLGVEPARALEAFYRPFGYAATRRPEQLGVAA